MYGYHDKWKIEGNYKGLNIETLKDIVKGKATGYLEDPTYSTLKEKRKAVLELQRRIRGDIFDWATSDKEKKSLAVEVKKFMKKLKGQAKKYEKHRVSRGLPNCEWECRTPCRTDKKGGRHISWY